MEPTTLLAIGGTLIMLVILFMLINPRHSQEKDRLNKVLGRGAPSIKSTDDEGDNLIQMLTQGAAKLGTQLFGKGKVKSQSRIANKLKQAGLYAPNAGIVYLTCKLVFAMIGGAIGVFFYLQNKEKPIWLAAGIVGYALPDYYLMAKRNKRKDKVVRSMSDMVDLIVVCVEAGLGLDAAFTRVSKELAVSSPELAFELKMVNLEIQTGLSREQALRNMIDRTGVEDVRSFCGMLIQAERFGTSIAKSLRIYADSLRTKIRQRLEEEAAKMAIKIAFPLVFFIFPALLGVILGPAAINIFNTFMKPQEE